MVRSACVLFALLVLTPGPASAQAAGADEANFRQMNDDYVRAFLASDVARFQVILADDFVGVLADGRVIDKAEFLRQAKVHPDAVGLRLHDVAIRAYADSAVVSAFVTYKRGDGSDVRTRYSTLYVRRDGRWAIIWVQWTRVTAP